MGVCKCLPRAPSLSISFQLQPFPPHFLILEDRNQTHNQALLPMRALKSSRRTKKKDEKVKAKGYKCHLPSSTICNTHINAIPPWQPIIQNSITIPKSAQYAEGLWTPKWTAAWKSFVMIKWQLFWLTLICWQLWPIRAQK